MNNNSEQSRVPRPLRMPLAVLFYIGVLFSANLVLAGQSAAIQGRLLNSNGTPVVSNSVVFTVQVKSPGAEDCLLYQESQTLDLSSSQGAFAITLGAGTRAAANVDGGNPLNIVFANSAAISLIAAATPCAGAATSYSPAASDTRKMNILFDDGSGVDQVPIITMAWVPQATYAQNSGQLGGTNSNQFLKVASGTTPTTLTGVDYTAFTALLAGTSSKYMSTSSTEGTTLRNLAGSPSTLAAGKIWYENGALKYYDGVSTSVKTLGTGSGSGTVTSVASGTGLTGGPITSAGTLSLASGVISTPGTYKSVTVDTYGRVTAGTNPTTASGYGITDAVLAGGQAGALTVGTSDASNLTLNTNNTAKLTILSTGNIGIGTAAPGEKLHVAGRIRQDPAGGVGGFLLVNGSNISDMSTINPGIDVFHDATNIYGFNLGYTTTTGRYSNQVFFPQHADYVVATHVSNVLPATQGSLTPRLTVRGDTGNVGIGTSGPQATLDVNGYARLKSYSSAPVACAAGNAGALALTSNYTGCACNGASWIKLADATACVW